MYEVVLIGNMLRASIRGAAVVFDFDLRTGYACWRRGDF